MDKFLNSLGVEKLTEDQIKLLPSPVLAYVGDAAYELYVRVWSAGIERGAIIKHHKRTVQHVKATTQATILKNIADRLTDEEQDVARKGRNAKSGNVPKNTPVAEYRQATGFEALMGYLYLLGRIDRLEELIAHGLVSVDQTGRNGENDES